MLQETRNKIDAIDEKMAKLFEERMNLVKEVISLKKKADLPILDSSREKKIIEMNEKNVSEEYRKYYIEFIKSMMDISKEYQNENL